MNSDWFALMLGNSHSHYAYFRGAQLKQTWHTLPLSLREAQEKFPLLTQVPLYIASVVPTQTLLWQGSPHSYFIELKDIPLKNLYPTLGIDRALALLGLVGNYPTPGLVIDAGTALTLTGVNSQAELVGGAILPGLKLQFDSLSNRTGALPSVGLPSSLPPRWATNTDQAIQSGIIYSVMAGLKIALEDWCSQFPESSLLITGGDAEYLFNYLKIWALSFSKRLVYEENLVFLGIRRLVLSI